MDEDEDNDERGEDNDDDEEDRTIRSYSKKKYFGKTTRDLKFLTSRADVRFQNPRLKVPVPNLAI